MIVLDSGVLIAAVDADDQHHVACVELLDRVDEQFVVPAGVVVEVCWMLGRRVSTDAETSFLRGLGGDGLTVETITTTDYQRAAELPESTGSLSCSSRFRASRGAAHDPPDQTFGPGSVNGTAVGHYIRITTTTGRTALTAESGIIGS